MSKLSLYPYHDESLDKPHCPDVEKLFTFLDQRDVKKWRDSGRPPIADFFTLEETGNLVTFKPASLLAPAVCVINELRLNWTGHEVTKGMTITLREGETIPDDLYVTSIIFTPFIRQVIALGEDYSSFYIPLSDEAADTPAAHLLAKDLNTTPEKLKGMVFYKAVLDHETGRLDVDTMPDLEPFKDKLGGIEITLALGGEKKHFIELKRGFSA